MIWFVFEEYKQDIKKKFALTAEYIYPYEEAYQRNENVK